MYIEFKTLFIVDIQKVYTVMDMDQNMYDNEDIN